MIKSFKRWLQPPMFAGDEEKTALARIANTLILYLVAALLITSFLLIPIFAIQKIGSWIIAGIMLGVLMAGRRLIFRGRWRAGIILIFGVIYLSIFALVILSGGSSSTAMFYLAAVVLVAGFFLESRLVNWFTISTFLVAMVISFLQDQEVVELPRVFVFNSVFSWLATSLGLLFMIRARDLFVGSLKNAVTSSRQKNAALQQTQANLSENEARFRAVVEHSYDGILFMDAGRKILYASPSYARLNGFSPSELVGQASIGFIHPEDQAVTAGKIGELLRVPGAPVTARYRIRHKDGSWRWIETFAQNLLADPAVRAIVLNSRDITERKIAEKAIQESEEKFRRLVETANEGVIVIDLMERMTLVNRQAAVMLGYAVEEMLGQMLETLFFARDLADHRTQMQGRVLGQSAVYERCFRRKDGSPLWVIVSATAIMDAEGHYAGSFGMLTDITERKRAEEEIRQSEITYRGIIDSLAEAVYVLDETGTFIDINQGAERMYGYARQELIGKSPAAVSAEGRNDLNQVMVQVLQAYHGTPQEFEFWGRRKNGQIFPKEVHCYPGTYFGRPAIIAIAQDITERKSAEQAVQESEEKYRTLFQYASDGIFYLSTDGKVLAVNESLARMHGYSAAEMQGMDLADLDTPEGMRRTPERMKRIMAGEIINFEVEHRHKDGHIFPLAVSSGLITVGGQQLIQAFHRDITERRRAEAALRESEQKHRRLFETMSQGIIYYSASGKIILANPAAEQILGASLDQLKGKTFFNPAWALFREDGSELPAAEYPVAVTLRTGKPVEHTILRMFNFNTRTMIWLSITVIPLFNPADENLYQVYSTFEDITESRRAAEDRMAREIAEQASRSKSEFLSRMSHELRTPLNSILGFAQLLKMDELKPAQAHSVNQIHKSGRHLLKLVNEVLDIARIEAGRMHMALEPLGLKDALEEALDLIRPLAEARRISLSLEAPAFQGVLVQADRQSFRQVLLNLLSNAVKYNREGGEITITARPTLTGRLRLQVCDTGEGIPPDKMERLFTPFDRLDRETIEQEGTGLGLALSKGLVEGMGGRIGAESQPGEGSAFWLELKLAPECLGEAIRAEVEKNLSSQIRTRRGLVLYVEDNLANLELVEAVMERLPQIKLITAMQGRLALDLAKEHHPDLILLDLRLPDVPGPELLRQLKAEPATSDIPVILQDAGGPPGQTASLLAQGGHACFAWPVEIREFLKILEETLGGTGSQAASQADSSKD